MILPMKKARVFVTTDRVATAVQELKALGMLHVEVDSTVSAGIDALNTAVARAQRAVTALADGVAAANAPVTGSDADASTVQAILETVDRIREATEERDKVAREVAGLQEWGNFDLDDIGLLERHRVFLRFVRCTRQDRQSFVAGSAVGGRRVVTLDEKKATVYLAVIDRLRTEDALPGVELLQPARSLAAAAARLSELDNRLAAERSGLADSAALRPGLVAYLDRLSAELEDARVTAAFADHAVVASVVGFVPERDQNAVKQAAAAAGWGVVLADPDDDDRVPTELRNPKAIRIIDPVFKLLGTVPGYRETDISFWFLLFFTLFFAMIIGDGGYGLVMLVPTVVALVRTRAAGKVLSPGLVLLTVLSSATVVWGAVTGNWFGYEPIAQLPFLRNLVVPSINAFAPESTAVVQWVCFVLGTVHLSIAHLVKFAKTLRTRPAIRAIAQLGWLSVVVGLYHLVLNVVIDADRFPVPSYALLMVAGGMAAVFIFENQEGRFFQGIVKSFANIIPTALSGISAFSDIISYIRLFAVGLASIEIAKSFNGMGVGMMESGTFGIIAGMVVILFGHTLNLAMAALSVVVHGVRLNMLEFSNHLGNEWAGFPYRPFGRKAT